MRAPCRISALKQSAFLCHFLRRKRLPVLSALYSLVILAGMTKTETRLLAAPIALTALFLASCGGDDSSNSSDSTSVPAVITEESATSEQTAEETSSDVMDPKTIMVSSLDSNPLTGGEISMSEAECIVEHIVAEDPDLFDVLVEAEMNESDLDDTDDLSATDATLVLNTAADCTRNSVSTLLQSENNLSADQAECLFDEIYGPDSVTMGFIALAAEMELMGVSEDEPEFVEAATEMMMVLMGEPSRIAGVCGIDESVVSTVLENSGADGVDTEDDMDYVDPYLDDGVDLGEIDIDSLDADVSPEQIMCMMEELQVHPELLETLLATGEVNTDNPADLMVLLEAGMACGISGF